MPSYKAFVKYKYGSGKADRGSSVNPSSLKGQTESAVMAYLKDKHKNIKDLEIIIEKIDWK